MRSPQGLRDCRGEPSTRRSSASRWRCSGSAISIVLAAASLRLVAVRRSTGASISAYGLGLAGILAVGYLTYLELFVIKAICVWCAAYAATIVAGWGCAAAAAWLTSDRLTAAA